MVKCVWFCCVVIGYDRAATCEHSLRLYSTVMHCERCNVYTSHCCISYNAIHMTVVYYRIWVSMASHRQFEYCWQDKADPQGVGCYVYGHLAS